MPIEPRPYTLRSPILLLYHYRWEFLIFCLGNFLIFTNLDNMYLWQDEAETALLGRTTLAYGYPYIRDGQNLITGYVGDYNEAFIHVTHPWVQYYLTAGSFALFGESTWAARFPFAACGVIALVLFYNLSARLLNDKTWALILMLMISVSVPFLLYGRQSRYYAPTLCCFLWTLVGYLKVLRQERYGHLHTGGAFILLYHSFPVAFLGTGLGLAVHAVWVARNQIYWPAAILTVIVIILTVAPFGYFQQTAFVAQQGIESTPVSLSIAEKFFRLERYLRDINLYYAPIWFLGVCGVAFCYDRSSRRWWMIGGLLILYGVITLASIQLLGDMSRYITGLGGFLFLCGVCYFGLSKPFHELFALGLVFLATLIVIVVFPPLEYFRYTIILIPLCVLATGLLLRHLATIHYLLAVLAGLVIIGTNTIQTFPYSLLRETSWQFSTLAPILSSPPVAWIAAIVANRSLDKAGDPESVARRLEVIERQIRQSTPLTGYLASYTEELFHDYDGPVESLVQYLKTHGDPTDSIMTNYDDLPLMWYTGMRVWGYAHSFPADVRPQWIIIRESPLWDQVKTQQLRELSAGYQSVTLNRTDIPWENLPDLWYHRFRTAGGPPYVTLFRRPES